jgi:hypothetical protein
MSLTRHQAEVLKSLADLRREQGESYVAGGVALNVLLGAARLSRDIDLFHDTQAALEAAVRADRESLISAGFDVRVVREAPSFVEVQVQRGGESVLLQWTRDSAFRFFPLVEHDQFGLVLHPFDLATNKVLAMAGRLEPRDWIDTLTCDERLQPLGLLAWAACGKDPGYNPTSLLAEISRAHYSQAELDTLEFDGARPDATDLGARWHGILKSARELSAALPASKVGHCVVTSEGEFFRGSASELAQALASGRIAFHAGRIRGAWPSVRPVEG